MIRLLFGLLLLMGLLPRASVSAECDLAAMVDNCSMNPSAVKYRWLLIGLCKGTPTIPTATTALAYPNCEILYDKIDEGGKVIEWNAPGDFGEFADELSIPANGTYDYVVYAVGKEYWVKFDVEFPTAMKTYGSSYSVSSGKFCRTIAGTNYHDLGMRERTLVCSDAHQEPEYTSGEFWGLGGIDSCSHWTGRYIKPDRTLATAFQEAIALVVVTPIDSLTISSDTSILELNWAFDELYRIDTDTSREASGWFWPLHTCPTFGISAQ